MEESAHVPHAHAQDISSTAPPCGCAPTPAAAAACGRRSNGEGGKLEVHVLVAKLFAKAYAPYALPPLVLILCLLIAHCNPLGLSTLISWCGHSAAELRIGAISILPTLALLYHRLRPLPVYLVDFSTYRPDDSYKLDAQRCARITRMRQKCSPRNMLFQLKVLLKSGIGDDVYGPPYMRSYGLDDGTPVRKTPGHDDTNEEMDLVLFGAIDELLLKTGTRASQIDYVFVNVSTFSPSPSLASHLVNHCKMREDVKAYNFSGMGCSAGMIGLEAAKDMLRVHKDKYAIVIGTENITSNMYLGNDRSMLVTNCLFRCGSFALLLSNQKRDKKRSKFQLLKTVRTNMAASDTAYNVIYIREDEHGYVGASLSVELLNVAAKAITISIMKLIPDFIPLTELLKVALNTIQRKVFKVNIKPYSLDFKRAFNHFGVHPGGKAVLDGIGKSLSLSDYDMEPSKMSLYRFGNTSTSGLWYAMSYKEAKERLKKGDKIWQIALGSGFKCSLVVWRALRDVKPQPGFNPWMEFIDQYPVNVPETIGPTHKHYAFLREAEEELRQIEAKEKEREKEHQELSQQLM